MDRDLCGPRMPRPALPDGGGPDGCEPVVTCGTREGNLRAKPLAWWRERTVLDCTAAFAAMDAEVVIQEFHSKGLEVDAAAAEACASRGERERTMENETGGGDDVLTCGHVRTTKAWRCVRT